MKWVRHIATIRICNFYDIISDVTDDIITEIITDDITDDIITEIIIDDITDDIINAEQSCLNTQHSQHH